MNNNKKKNDKNKQSRREFIKRSGISAGVVCTGLFSGNSYAAKESTQGKENENPVPKGVPKASGYREPAREVPVLAEYEVVVCGGGAAGCAAALAAARHGARTLLIEREGYLGGTTVMALVNIILSTNGVDFQGVWHEWARTLLDLGGCARMSRAKCGYNVQGWQFRSSVDPEMVKCAWDRLLTHAGVDVLFHAHLAGAIVESDAIRGVLVETVAVRRAVYAKRVVDCTGDAIVCDQAGVPWDQGYKNNPLGMAVNLIGLRSNGKESLLFDCGGSAGTVGNRPENRGGPAERSVDVLDPWALSRTTQVLRRKHWGSGQLMGKPYLIETGSRPGVRASRRVCGVATVTSADVWALRKWPDGIARSTWELDIHPPSRDPIPVSLKNQNADYVEWQRRLAKGDYFDIRLGCLVAKGVDNLLVAGRCISADYLAQSSLRIQQTCQSTGQAAGTAAALSLKENVTPGKLDPLKVVAQLDRDRSAVAPAFDLLKNLPEVPRG